MNKKTPITMVVRTYTYRVYPNKGSGWRNLPLQRGDGVGGKWRSMVVQRGDGIGSLFGKMARKFLPMAGKFASKTLNTVKNSKMLKEAGNAILDKSVQGLTEVVSNAIEGGTDKKSAGETAQIRLDQARKDIARIIRKNGEYSNTDESSDEDIIDIPVKRKRRMNKAKQKRSKRKKYNLLKNIK